MILSTTPSLDLHGMDREITKILVDDFINDNHKLKIDTVIIIHGKGQGILRKTVHETLKKNKLVEKYYLDYFNDGCTVVSIKN